MAMIKCHECSEEISDSAATCPKCGAKVPRFKWWLWVPIWLVGGFIIIGLVARGGGESKDASAGLLPEQTVILSDIAFGCEYESTFVSAANHHFRKEYSAWASVASEENGCFSSLPQGLELTVMQVREPLVQVGFSTAIQYAAAVAALEKEGKDPRLAEEPYWTFVKFVSPNSPHSPI